MRTLRLDLEAKSAGRTLGMFILFLVLTLSMFSSTLHAEEKTEPPKGHLEGFVYDKDGETPVKGVQVKLEQIEKGKKTGKTFESNITDETGEYKLENIPVGFYKGKIFIKEKRYRIKRLDFFIHVIANETNFLSFSLKRIKGRKLP
jgi:5-hydroxyisourate hydrolase-like protein (transthyretin family)